MKTYLKMPVITFGNYQLRTIKKRDYKDMYAYGKDPETVQYLSWGPFVDPSEAKWSIQNIFYPRLKEQLPRGYAIIDLSKRKMIGTIDFHSKIDGVNGAEIGYALNRAYWNQGIMTEALKLMIEVGFCYLGYDEIKISHLDVNQRSQKVILKNGFQFIYQTHQTFNKRNTVLQGQVLHYILKKEQYHGSQ